MRILFIVLLALFSTGSVIAQSPNSRILIIGIEGVMSDTLTATEIPDTIYNLPKASFERIHHCFEQPNN